MTEKEKNISNALLLRTLSMKSKLEFGPVGNLLIAEVIKVGKQSELVWNYYNLSMISFLDEVLDAIGIGLEDRIEKPGKDPKKGEEVLKRLETNDLEKSLKDNKHRFVNHHYPKIAASQKLN